LTLHPRGDHDRARLGQRLSPRRNVGRIAENLARRIDYYRAGFDTGARFERRLAKSGRRGPLGRRPNAPSGSVAAMLASRLDARQRH
jgi:hypothetical protein